MTTFEADLADLLRYVADNDGASTARIAKQMCFARSELQRLVTTLGDAAHGGLGLIAVEVDGVRDLLHLTPAGRAWLDQHP